MDLDKYFSDNPSLVDYSDVPDGFKSGFVTFVGRPNSGKSTLLNSLVNQKIAITSPTVQTTRHSFRGIVNQRDAQIIICDTPGIHKPKDALGEELNIFASQAVADADVVCLLLDVSQEIGHGDRWIVSELLNGNQNLICILTKTDLVSNKRVNEQIINASKLTTFCDIIPISAKEKEGLDDLVDAIKPHLTHNHLWFPKDQICDVDDDVFVSELVREQVLKMTFDEVPHSIGVIVEEIIFDKNRNIVDILCYIVVERDSQKGIIIGDKGSMIKKIGSFSRKNIELFFDKKVNLQLSVKVKKNWRRDANMIKKFGYAT